MTYQQYSKKIRSHLASLIPMVNALPTLMRYALIIGLLLIAIFSAGTIYLQGNERGLVVLPISAALWSAVWSL